MPIHSFLKTIIILKNSINLPKIYTKYISYLKENVEISVDFDVFENHHNNFYILQSTLNVKAKI